MEKDEVFLVHVTYCISTSSIPFFSGLLMHAHIVGHL